MVRIATHKDVQAMLELYAYYVLESNITFEYEVPSLEEFAQRLNDVQSQFPWLVYEENGRIAGYAYASWAFTRAAYQWNAELSIYLHEDYQRKGVAGELYQCLEETLLQQGYYYLYAVINADNMKSISMAKKLGFIEAGYYKNAGFKRGKWLDVVCSIKELKKPTENPPKPVAYNDLPKGCAEQILACHQI